MLGSFPALLVSGSIGGLLFHWFKIPGGPMVGSMLSVILYNLLLTGGHPVALPSALKLGAYILMGVVVGSMFHPEMLSRLRESWHMLFISSVILLAAGVFSAYLTYKTGTLSATSAFLATSPGGLNALTGLAAQMGEDAPIILLYQMTRMYTVVLTAPLIGRWLLR